MPALYVVATPIGNLEDISRRALRILGEAKLIAAEDTRKTRRLLSAYGIKVPMISYHEHNKLARLDYLLGFLETGDVALVSEAGTPGISDPGYELIVAASQRGIPVVPIPGPSVVTAALAVSGLATDRFTYLGFLPRRSSSRQRLLEEVANVVGTLVIMEAPHRLRATLDDMLLVLGDRRVAICRELTKVHEEIFRGSLSQAIAHFAEPRGEFTLVVEGGGKKRPELAGVAAREAVAELAKTTGMSRRELYRIWLEQG